MFTFLCPMGGSLVVRGVNTAAWWLIDDPWNTLLPDYVVKHFPPMLPATVVSSILLLAMPFFFDFVDSMSVAKASEMAAKVKDKGKSD
eukprot:scaffold462_cov195-Pinguiococcus_pyrenoidosus.AAC.27